MMTSQPLFIPLYFDDAEEDLWLVLQGIEPEKRSSFIKQTLRQVLIEPNREDFLIQSLNKEPEDIPDALDDSDYYHEEIQAEVIENEFEETETFSLDDLFAQTHVPNPDEEPDILTDDEQTKSIPNPSSGFEYMMKHIIGTEEDEAVLKVLCRRSNQGDRSKKPEVSR